MYSNNGQNRYKYTKCDKRSAFSQYKVGLTCLSLISNSHKPLNKYISLIHQGIHNKQTKTNTTRATNQAAQFKNNNGKTNKKQPHNLLEPLIIGCSHVNLVLSSCSLFSISRSRLMDCLLSDHLYFNVLFHAISIPL